MNSFAEQYSPDWQNDPPAPLRFERRREDRWPASGAASAICVAGEAFGHIHDLKLLDIGHGGLAALCDEPVTPGTFVSVGFQQPGMHARRGNVLRCQPCGDGYRVAVQFDLRSAA